MDYRTPRGRRQREPCPTVYAFAPGSARARGMYISNTSQPIGVQSAKLQKHNIQQDSYKLTGGTERRSDHGVSRFVRFLPHKAPFAMKSQ